MSNNTKKLSRLVQNLNILGSDITIEYREEVLHEDGESCAGLMYGTRNHIIILDNDKVPYESQLSTLLHECIECMVMKLELNVEHRDISAMETSFFQLMRDNPNLCKAFALYQPRSK